MPYVSKAQQGFFHTHVKEIGSKVVKEFDKASKGKKNLTEHKSSKRSKFMDAIKKGFKTKGETTNG